MSSTASVCVVCSKPTNSICSRCHAVGYCSKEHQKSDWRNHKSTCTEYQVGSAALFRVSRDNDVGRHLVSARTIREGEQILEESPLVTGPFVLTPPVCLGCYRPLNKFRSVDCSSCGWPVCSIGCEKSKNHRVECEITQQFRKQKVKITNLDESLNHPSYMCITILRCLYLKNSNEDKWTKISKLESHYEERKRDSAKIESDSRIAEFVERFFDLHDFSKEDVSKMAGIVEVNAHEVLIDEASYLAIYDKASLLEHSCLANCTKSFTVDGRIIIRAGRDIQMGEHLTICYVLPLSGLESRRRALLEFKYFECKCPRCTDPTEFGTHFNSIKCTSEDCYGYAVPAASENCAEFPSRCTGCGKMIFREEVTRILTEVNEIARTGLGSTDEAKYFLKEYGNHFHPNHHLMVELKMKLLRIYDSIDSWLNLEETDVVWILNACESLIDLSAKLAPAEHRLRGILHYWLQKAMGWLWMERSKFEIAKEYERRRGSRKQIKDVLMKAKYFLKSAHPHEPEHKMAIEVERRLQVLNDFVGFSF